MPKKIAMVFPGQGSQSTGMLSDFSSPLIEHTFQEASHVLGYDLGAIVKHNSEGKLNQTAMTQPALLTASVALWRLWQEQGGVVPLVLAGHSLGEYSALVCSGVITFHDAVYLVSQRGKFMQEAVREGQGAMAAIIGLTLEQVGILCREISEKGEGEVSPANINSPGHTVVAGHAYAVEQAIQQAKAMGAKLVKKLEVSVPSHCVLMKPAAEKLETLLENISFHPPRIPVVHNVDACIYREPAAIKHILSQQLISPVRWVENVEKIVKSEDIELIIECGPGRVLSGLNKRIVNIPALFISEPSFFEEALKLCLG